MKSENEHEHPTAPDYDGDNHPEHEPREPSWSDVIGGIWNRLTHPIPPTG